VKSLKKKVLIVEDDEVQQRFYAALLKDSAEVLQATTISQAIILLADGREDVAIMVFDGNVPLKPEGGFVTTMYLIEGIRIDGVYCVEKFTGPMIATSSSKQLLAEQIAAGCDYACPKMVVPDLVKLLLHRLG
jgi:CheY-like chemotaxis protein